jgi:heme/copper-type cytochrome/quinol oxidase subunit 3
MAATTIQAGTPAALSAGGGTRPRNLVATGTALLCAGATTLFGALLAAYVELRGHGGEWVPKDLKLDNYLGNMLVITMLLGSLSVQWAVSAVKRDERRQASAAFGVAMGFGAAFLNLLSYTISKLDLPLADSPYAVVVGAMAFLLGIVVVLAMGYAFVTVLRLRGEQVRASDPDLARGAAWFWQYATLATVVVWFAVVVRK